ncbi:MAG: hypothetical protein HYV97_03710 [Bdellovibrio sp.]|nr:hypothetical protein [Bdellovibrio sp.]
MIWKIITSIGATVLLAVSVYVLKKGFSQFKNKGEANHPLMILFELLTETNAGLLGAILFALSLLFFYAAITMHTP